MSIIKITLKEEKTYQQCFIESHEGEIIHIICDDAEKRNDLIALISGKKSDSGVCALNGINTKADLEQYKKKVDMIDLKKVNSTLTVKDYIVFYAMVTGIYHEKTIEELNSLLMKNQMEHLLDTPVNALSNIEKIKVRCIAAYMKQVNCLVGEDLLSELDWLQKEAFYEFLEEYFIKEHCLCVLFDNMQEEECEKEILHCNEQNCQIRHACLRLD